MGSFYCKVRESFKFCSPNSSGEVLIPQEFRNPALRPYLYSKLFDCVYMFDCVYTFDCILGLLYPASELSQRISFQQKYYCFLYLQPKVKLKYALLRLLDQARESLNTVSLGMLSKNPDHHLA